MERAPLVPTNAFDYVRLKLWKNLHQRGLLGTLRIAGRKLVEVLGKLGSPERQFDLADQDFDRRHGVKTNIVIDLKDVDAAEHPEFGNSHQPTPAAALHPLVSNLPIQHSDFVFVDLGCGMGRAAFLASDFPFKKIVGVEFSAELHRIAEQNRLSFRHEKQRCTNIEFVRADAAEYSPPNENTVFYLFNPFGEPTLRQVVENIGHSLEQCPHEVLIIYYNPTAADVLDTAPFLERVHSSGARLGSHACTIYRNIKHSVRRTNL